MEFSLFLLIAIGAMICFGAAAVTSQGNARFVPAGLFLLTLFLVFK